MSATHLTPLERFTLTLAHKQPDRPPIVIWLTPEVRMQLEDHFERQAGNRSIEENLDLDFRYVYPIPLMSSVAPSAAEEQRPKGIYQDVVSKPLAWIRTLDDVSRYEPYHNPKAFDFSGLAQACQAARPFVRIFGTPGMFDIVNGLGARGRGMENLLCEMIVEDPVVVALIDKHLDHDFRYCQTGLEAGRGEIEVLHIGEDCGNQGGTLFPPEFFRSFFAPRLRRFVDLAHQHGAVCMLHSCGSVRGILPVLIEEVGLDIQDACQPEAKGMGPERLKQDFGRNITFCGMLSLQKTLTRGTAEDCRREAECLIRVIGKDGGYIFAPANTITQDTPLENVLAAYEVATGKNLL